MNDDIINITNINPHINYSNDIKGVTISWDDLSSMKTLKRYVLVRKRYDYPAFLEDGDLIYEGNNNYARDTTCENGLSYYYVLFLIVDRTIEEVTFEYMLSSDMFRLNFVVNMLSNNADKMYNSLPDLYRNIDHNIDAYLPKPLYRYFQVIGYQFDKIENLINLILTNINIDSCASKFLPIISHWLGIDYDWSLSVNDNRNFINLQIENYTRKGTYAGLKNLLQNISKSVVDIVIDKTPVTIDSTDEKISHRRSISVHFNLDEEGSSSWVSSKQDKVLDIIAKNVPKKNLPYVSIFIDVDFADVFSLRINSKYRTVIISGQHGLRGISRRGYNLRGVDAIYTEFID